MTSVNNVLNIRTSIQYLVHQNAIPFSEPTRTMETGEHSSTTYEQIESDRLAQIRDAFSVFDRDGDGRITVDELGAVMASLGEHPSESELKRMISEFDEDGLFLYI
ncbi:Calmodulin [Toxocara canis]|uniref:Calmodulin n=1 Tax=Toxocara canis TaxID=6265 RepID=A0A0B2W3L3_TOXCA|nr:Calmodulin [Toxocara canis]